MIPPCWLWRNGIRVEAYVRTSGPGFDLSAPVGPPGEFGQDRTGNRSGEAGDLAIDCDQPG